MRELAQAKYNQTQVDVEQALNKLPVESPFEPSVRHEIAKNIITVSGLSRTNDLLQAKNVGSAQAIKELDEFIKKSIRLHEHIKSMSTTSRKKLDDTSDELNRSSYLLEDELVDLVILAEKGKAELLEIKNIPARGKPRALQAERLTDYLFSVFTEHVGTQPPWSVDEDGKQKGPFLDFVQSIFEALDIKNRPDSQVKSCLERNKK